MIGITKPGRIMTGMNAKMTEETIRKKTTMMSKVVIETITEVVKGSTIIRMIDMTREKDTETDQGKSIDM